MSNPPSLPPKEYTNGASPAEVQPQPQQEQPSVKIPLPECFQSLPTSEIAKLTSSLNVLKGYLITLVSDDLQQDIALLDQINKDIDTFIGKLQELNSSKQETDVKLSNYQSLLKSWESKEKQMYQSLARFNNDSIHKLLTSSIIESRQLAASIQQSFINHPDVHTDQSVQKFIQDYQAERKLYHLRSEKLQRLYENRVNGMYL